MSALSDDYQRRFGSIGRLYGSNALERLRAAHVAIVGVGGVGSWTTEALARSGIGNLTLIDLDDVCLTNTGRQLPALESTIGRAKVEVLAERIREINPGCQVNPVPKFFLPGTVEELLSRPFDCLVDAIDRSSTKALLIGECRRRGQPLVTCGSAGGRRDPTLIRIDDLALSSQDLLLQQVRRALRDDFGFPKGSHTRFDVPCVYSLEKPVYAWPDGQIRSEPPPLGADRKLDCSRGYGAATHVTGAFGFAAAGRVMQMLIEPPSPTHRVTPPH